MAQIGGDIVGNPMYRKNSSGDWVRIFTGGNISIPSKYYLYLQSDGINGHFKIGGYKNRGTSNFYLNYIFETLSVLPTGVKGLFGNTYYGNTTGRFGLYYENGQIYAYIATGTTNMRITTGYSPATNKKYNIIVNYNRSGNMSLYVDGTLIQNVDISTYSADLLTCTNDLFLLGYGSVSNDLQSTTASTFKLFKASLGNGLVTDFSLENDGDIINIIPIPTGGGVALNTINQVNIIPASNFVTTGTTLS